ncbi:MAG: hypothetical protein ACERKZ_07740 [Lachnotalea sp.]
MMIFTWVFLVLGIYYFIYYNQPIKVRCNNLTKAEDILIERYVNGEIDEVTFKKMKMTINN